MGTRNWADKIAKTKRAGIEVIKEPDPQKLEGFIAGATADSAVEERLLEDAQPINVPTRSVIEAEKPLSEHKKERVGRASKSSKPKRPPGRPARGIEVIKRQFDIPVDLAERLSAVAAERFADNQTRALWEALRTSSLLFPKG